MESGAACARANERMPVCFVRRKLNWNEIIVNLKIQAKTALLPDKVKSPSTLMLSLVSPSAQIWHHLSWVHRSSLSSPCYQRLIYVSASGWEEAPCSLEEFPTLLWNGEVSSCCVSLSSCILHYPEEFALWFILNLNLLCFQRIPASNGGTGTVSLYPAFLPFASQQPFNKKYGKIQI